MNKYGINLIHIPENHQSKHKTETALNKLSPPWCATDPECLPDCIENDFIDSPFSFIALNIALKSKNPHSSCGTDGIDYKKMALKYKLILVDILNEMYRKNQYPIEWTEFFVHFINKANKKSVRPICLTSYVSNLFETMLKNKLQYWYETENILPTSQSGFRKGQYTIENLTNLLLTAEESFCEKRIFTQPFRT